ncbi:MAG: helix-turn-helix domain-containing protein [Xanthomonadales bacterium]|nr:helix-turn-helix domain-containing protein [Xanthomonadales bacterium]
MDDPDSLRTNHDTMLNPSHFHLPLVRLNLVSPLLDQLQRRGVNAGPVLAEHSLTAADIDNPELFVTAPSMYRLVEALAEASGDAHFGFRVGEQLDPFSWSPLKSAVEDSLSLGGTLLRFMENAPLDESSVSYTLTVSGGRVTFRERRFTDGGILPRHNDGFTVAYLVTIIHRAMSHDWDGARVIAHVCDPAVIPRGNKGIKVAQQDSMGASISFPSTWLLHSMSTDSAREASGSASTKASPETSIVLAFRQAIRSHLHEFDLDTSRAAEICGVTKRTLSRKLQAKGTTILKELESMREEKATAALRETDRSIRAVANMVGYENPVVFSRAFKRWHGMTPSQYRIEQDAP